MRRRTSSRRCRWARKSPCCATAPWCRSGRPTSSMKRPRDLYVAGKIGSPHMNMIEGTLARDGTAIESAVGPLPSARRLEHARKPAKRPWWASGRATSASRRAAKAASRRASPCSNRWATSRCISMDAGGETLRMVLPEAAASGLQARSAGSRSCSIQAKFHVFRASTDRRLPDASEREETKPNNTWEETEHDMQRRRLRAQWRRRARPPPSWRAARRLALRRRGDAQDGRCPIGRRRAS